MTRWSQYDEDEYRLPEGMERIGYDADTQTYSYQDSDGTYWEGQPGNRYGQLHRVSPNPPSYQDDVDDASEQSFTPPPPYMPANERFTDFGQLQPAVADIESQDAERRRKDWAQFAPFLVIIGVVLLLVFHFMSSVGDSNAD